MALYKSLSRHSAPGVAKRAKQMLFGFDSMNYLKTHTMSCAPALCPSSNICSAGCPARNRPARGRPNLIFDANVVQ